MFTFRNQPSGPYLISLARVFFVYCSETAFWDIWNKDISPASWDIHLNKENVTAISSNQKPGTVYHVPKRPTKAIRFISQYHEPASASSRGVTTPVLRHCSNIIPVQASFRYAYIVHLKRLSIEGWQSLKVATTRSKRNVSNRVALACIKGILLVQTSFRLAS